MAYDTPDQFLEYVHFYKLVFELIVSTLSQRYFCLPENRVTPAFVEAVLPIIVSSSAKMECVCKNEVTRLQNFLYT